MLCVKQKTPRLDMLIFLLRPEVTLHFFLWNLTIALQSFEDTTYHPHSVKCPLENHLINTRKCSSLSQGLDPALPFFASLSRSWKLDANDARFVDVIHTNVGVLGKVDNTGHADFYVNGGSVQPACNNSKFARTAPIFISSPSATFGSSRRFRKYHTTC
jgi:hypothetical protein